jgi:phosphate transport system protein
MMKKPHTIPAYDHELEALRGLLETMGDRAEGILAGTLDALQDRNVAEARRLVTLDNELDTLEMTIDRTCLTLLARWQPVASDLRFIATALKAVTDLERVGDQSVNICERVAAADDAPPLQPPVDLMTLGRTAQALVQDALRALREENPALAEHVIAATSRADLLARQVLRACFEALRRDPQRLHQATSTYEIASCLRRIAAHASNIAELVIFLVRGEDVRHPDNPSPTEGGRHEA